jgi:excinuclease ABC subunit C
MEERISTDSPYEIPNLDKEIKKFINEIPRSPGVYKFLDKFNNPIYIGKAKLLNKRVSSYFRKSSRSKKIIKLLQQAAFIEFILTNTELEALLHEQFLIKEFKPKFNVQFKDDKGYPWIKIETKKSFPAAKSYLGKKLENGNFYGPFPNSYAVRDALKLIQKTFKLRNCSDAYFKNRTRPCLQYEIGRCSAPCIGLISKKDYLLEVNSAELLLQGKSEDLINNFYSSMDEFSRNRDYEKAAIYRDRISALRDIQRSQSIAGFNSCRDAIYVSSLSDKVKIGVTSVNQGWVTGHKNYLQIEGFDEKDILENFITQKYLNAKDCPEFLVINQTLDNKSLLEKALSEKFLRKISIITRPGKKDKGLLDTCKANTEYTLRKNKIDKNIGIKFKQLKEGLQLKNEPNLIESYDISHHAGKNAVAGCVVYTAQGKVSKLYRTYNINKSNWGNDIGSMIEVIERRFSGANSKELPSLVIIDGGKTHLKQVLKTIEAYKIRGVDIISISKGVRRKANFDTIHLPNGKSVSIDKTSIFHQFVQEIRDETHRYAITLQKKKMRKTSIKSSLDDLTGIGTVRKKILLRYFGSFEQIKRASVDDLSEVSGIGKSTAQSIYKELHT